MLGTCFSRSLPTDAHVRQHRIAQLMKESLGEGTVKEHSDYGTTLAKIEEHKAWQDSRHGAEAKVRTGTCSRDRSRSRSCGHSRACTHSQLEETPRQACPRRLNDHVAVQIGEVSHMGQQRGRCGSSSQVLESALSTGLDFIPISSMDVLLLHSNRVLHVSAFRSYAHPQ